MSSENQPSSPDSPSDPSPTRQHSGRPAQGQPPGAAPAQVYLAPRSSWKTRLLVIGLVVAVVLLFQQQFYLRSYFSETEGLQERFHSGDKWAAEKIAIIRVEGVVMSGEGYIKKQIDQVRRDGRVRAVVLRVDSPGGTVSGADYILHHLQELRKDRDLPLVVSMGASATSGGITSRWRSANSHVPSSPSRPRRPDRSE